MEGIIKKICTSFVQFFPVVKADDSEDELSDPQISIRQECEKKECPNLFAKLESCKERVLSKKKTAETCDEEMVDFINCLDECVAKTLFTKLK